MLHDLGFEVAVRSGVNGSWHSDLAAERIRGEKEMSQKERADLNKEIAYDPIQLLKKEHEETLRKLEVAKQAMQSFRDLPGNTDPQQRVSEEAWIKDFVVSLMREVRLHFQKEEEALFPILAEYIGKEHGPIEVMLHEHEILRLAFRDWEGLLIQFCESQGPDKQGSLNALIASGDEAFNLFRQHSSKESKILFKICEASLSGEEKRMVSESIEAIGAGRAGKT